MKKSFIVGLLGFMLLFGLTSAYTLNYTSSSTPSASVLDVIQLKYEPYPVNPGEYFDLWIKAQWSGVGNANDATFELKPAYPFSLDSNENPIRDFGKITTAPVVMKYRVRVDNDAVEGINQLNLKYKDSSDNNYWVLKTFDIQVANAQTDFDLVIQESTGTSASIAIANIGTNIANSLIVRIPEQTNYQVSGTNGQMVGNLNSGDYTIVSFNVIPISRGANDLKVQLDYTDTIGKRRSIIKDVKFISSSPMGNMTRYGQVSRGGNFSRGSFTSTQASTPMYKNMWFWVVVVAAVGIGYYFYRKRLNLDKDKSGSSRSSKESPEWVSAERTKRK